MIAKIFNRLQPADVTAYPIKPREDFPVDKAPQGSFLPLNNFTVLCTETLSDAQTLYPFNKTYNQVASEFPEFGPGAKVFGKDQSGKHLAPGDIVQTANGEIKLSKEKALELEFRTHVVENAEILSKSKLHFSPFKETQFSENYWTKIDVKTIDPETEKTILQTGWQPREGKPPSEAISDLFRHPENYSMECQTGVHVLLIKAALDTLGENKFNEKFQNMTLLGRLIRCKFTEDPEHKRSEYFPGAGIVKFGNDESIKVPLDKNRKPLPGDWVYFYNPQGRTQAAKSEDYCWYGENAIKMPGEKYYAHGADREKGKPLGLLSEREIVEKIHLKGNDNRGEQPFLSEKVGSVSIPHFLYLLEE